MAEKPDVSDLIVVRLDGGICSQVKFTALGLQLQRKFGSSVRVKYDLSWFAECGKDMDGCFVRNWDMPKAFPGVDIPVATPEEIAALKDGHGYMGTDDTAISAPMYVGGYPSCERSLSGQLDFLRESFRPELSAYSREMLSRMRSSPCCAVHVRRGDLAVHTDLYGSPASPRYFATAMKIIRLAQPGVRAFLFSDEPDYVCNELLPVMPDGIEYVVVDGNGSDRGYEDLYLVSRADYIIASVGTLGRMAAKFSTTCKCVVVMRSHGGGGSYDCEMIALDDLPQEKPRQQRKRWIRWLNR